MKFAGKIYHSFPIKLLITHLKFNPLLMLYWLILFMIVGGRFGQALGIPYLFLDPVYIQKVDFFSFLIMGLSLAGFTMAFNITAYILDSFRFPFLGTLPKPFSHFCLNNSLIPLLFLIYYVYRIISFQLGAEQDNWGHILIDVAGLLCGYAIMLFVLFAYFLRTNRDVFKVLNIKFDPRIIRPTKQRRNAFRKLRRLRRNRVRVDRYLSLTYKFYSTKRYERFYDRVAILRVFNQNQRNAIRAELLIFLLIIALGLFKSSPAFQIPAAASSVLLFTIIIMFTGAMTYWFRGWSLIMLLAGYFLINFLFAKGIFSSFYAAYGLNYQVEEAVYDLRNINALNRLEIIEADKRHTLGILDRWKEKFDEEKPKMILITSSGGGQRSALWTTHVLQQADSALEGNLMKHATLITGASGGLIGSSYYRDKYLDQLEQGQKGLPSVTMENMGKEVLNPVIFSMLVNDIFIKFQSFDYAGHTYKQERGYAFEQQLQNNLGLTDRKLIDYQQPEQKGEIPMLIISPTVVNDGRKLFISPQPVSYFNLGLEIEGMKLQGVDFRALLNKQSADSLRFLTALRMSATFPYITPNVSLPTVPSVQIADAGISDNFGISDALTFLYVFNNWILENTSGVVLLTIRDSMKEGAIQPLGNTSLTNRLFSPLSGVLRNWDHIQTLKNEQKFEFVQSLFGEHLQRVEFEYRESSSRQKENRRASLSWRLTEMEKKSIIQAIRHDFNQDALSTLSSIFQQ